MYSFGGPHHGYRYIVPATNLCRPVVDSNILSQPPPEKTVPVSKPMTTSAAYGQYAAASLQAKGGNNTSSDSIGTPVRLAANSRAAGYATSKSTDAPAAGVASNASSVRGALFGSALAPEPSSSRPLPVTQVGSTAHPTSVPAAFNPACPLVDAWSPPRPMVAGNLDHAPASSWQPSRADVIGDLARAWESSSYADPYLNYSSAQGAGLASNGVGGAQGGHLAGNTDSGAYALGQPVVGNHVSGEGVPEASAAASAKTGTAAGSQGAGTPYATERTLKVCDLVIRHEGSSHGAPVLTCCTVNDGIPTA